MKRINYFWRKGLWTLFSLLFLFIAVVTALYVYASSQLPKVESLKTVKFQVPLRIYTQDGLLIQEYGEKRCSPLAFQDIPKTLVYAILATEDQRFFEHPGVDIFGLGRAAINMVQTGRKSQGGSTITMQVARNFFLNRKKTFLRKFNEIMLAVKIDRELTKEKILELYLNQIYLGNRAYGVGAAAKIYYGKELKDLSIAQLAMIAGLPQAPSTHNPIANPKAAKKRRNHVLKRLYEENYISKAQYDEARHEPISARYHGTKIEVSAPYVAEMIRQSLYDHFGPDAYTNGYEVYTTIDSKLQKSANNLVEDHLLAYDNRHGYRGPVSKIDVSSLGSTKAILQKLKTFPPIGDLEVAVITDVADKSATAITANRKSITIPWQGLSWARPALRKGWVGRSPTAANQVVKVGDIVYIRQQNEQYKLSQDPQAEAALVAIDPKNGSIEALVGGFNFQRSKFNRVTQSYRQPGSSFKPFIFAAAINKGYSLATLINDAPIVVKDPSQNDSLWRPHNVKYKFNGPTRLRQALSRSVNLVSIRILEDIGIDYAIDFAGRFGFKKSTLPHSLSLALGSLTVSPIDITAAYAVFANGGYKVEPFLIDHITDSSHNILLQAKASSVCYNCEENQRKFDVSAPRVIPQDVAFLMNSALQDVIQHGTGTLAKSLNRNDIAGKTGTTNQQMDAWFCGYSPDLAVTTWIGFDSPRSLHEYASRLALPLWIDFMKVALQEKPEQIIEKPDNIVAININPKTGLRATSDQSRVMKEYFRDINIPQLDNSTGFNSQNTNHQLDSQDSLF